MISLLRDKEADTKRGLSNLQSELLVNGKVRHLFTLFFVLCVWDHGVELVQTSHNGSDGRNIWKSLVVLK